MMVKQVTWAGVFPAVTTQFRADDSIDFAATQAIVRQIVAEGIDGVIACGSVGEASTLTAAEKRDVVAAVKEAAGGKVPVISGVAESSTASAITYARDMAKASVDGLMVMPPMVYSANAREIASFFKSVAGASDLPVMIYNNPPAYRNDVTPGIVAQLTDVDTIVAVKESSGDTRRFVDLQNTVGDRFKLFCGLDDVVLETVALGAVGWISGLSNVFPRECAHLFALARAGKMAEALPLYRWLMPLLHLDARADLVQCIKLCEQIMGRGSERTRAPRLVLEGADRAHVEAVMKQALATRPKISDAA